MTAPNRIMDFNPGNNWLKISTIDMHTCGEPLRVFTEGLPDIPGKTILEKRKYFMENLDNIRTSIMFEPRGHADMYGAVITEPVTDGADFGAFFMHNEGYSTMCGHAIIALTKFAIETGFIRKDGDEQILEIDAPPGRIRSRAFMKDGKVEKVSFLNVPSFLLIENEMVDVPGIGRVMFDVAYGGAFYAFCDADRLGLNLDASGYTRLIDYGRRIKSAVMENFRIDHPFEPDLSFLYGTIFYGAPFNPGHWSRNVCIFADGEVDRSPTGSGISARAGLHYARRELAPGKKVTIESIIGTTMDVEITVEVDYGGYRSVIPEITGTAFFTGRNQFWVDPDDPLKNGFILR